MEEGRERRKGESGFKASAAQGIGERWKHREEGVLADKNRESHHEHSTRPSLFHLVTSIL